MKTRVPSQTQVSEHRVLLRVLGFCKLHLDAVGEYKPFHTHHDQETCSFRIMFICVHSNNLLFSFLK